MLIYSSKAENMLLRSFYKLKTNSYAHNFGMCDTPSKRYEAYFNDRLSSFFGNNASFML